MAEYFDLAVRFTALVAFFATVPPLVTQHKLCDLAFCFLYGRDKRTVRFLPDDPQEFVYFYGRGNQAGGASNMVQRASDAELEQSGLDRLPREVSVAFAVKGDPTAACVDFISTLRQAIEQEMGETPWVESQEHPLCLAPATLPRCKLFRLPPTLAALPSY